MEKINVAELLKDCPKGMELDCTMFEGVYFDHVDDLRLHRIKCYVNNGNEHFEIAFDKHGKHISNDSAKCVIFPKGKTTWEGFVPPCQFKDGDVVVAEDNESFQLFLLKHLTHCEDYNDHDGYCYFGWDFQCNELFEKGNWGFNRLATEEEKQYLFDTIKDNGYKWNEETKTLERLPKFKDGDIVYIKTRGYNQNEFIIIFKEIKNDHIYRYISFSHQTLYTIKNTVCHLINVEEIRFATEEEKAELFNAIKANGYKWNPETKTLEMLIEPKFKVGDRIKRKDADVVHTIKEVGTVCYVFDDLRTIHINVQDNYELIPDKFDINTLVPFESRVLVRNSDSGFWQPTFWGIYESEKANEHQYRNYLTTKGFFRYCIPYNDDTKHLLGTTNDCDEYFKTWG